jgi:hypothetical protein
MGIEAIRSLLMPHRLVMAAVFAGAVGAGWIMLPGDGERVAMLEQDGHAREALAVLEHRYNSGDRSYRTLYQMQGLYEEQGDVAKAQGLLEEMSRQRPWDSALKSRLAEFFKGVENEPSEIAALEAEIDLKYSEAACGELAAIFRVRGDFAQEKSVLLRCRQNGYRRTEDLSRLADLLAADGDLVQASAILRAIDDVKRLKTVREKYQLLTMLLDQDEPKEAERRALKWLRAAKDDAFAVGLLDLLAKSKYPDTALEIARETGSPGDAISLTIAERLIERAQPQAAELYLRGWLESAAISDGDTAQRFIEAALAAGDAETALRAARQYGVNQLSSATLTHLASSLNAQGFLAAARDLSEATAARSDGAIAVNERLGPEPIALAPGVDKATGRPPVARLPRTLAVRDDPLEGWRQSLLSKVGNQAERRKLAMIYGPPPPPSGVHLHGQSHFRPSDVRLEPKGSAKLLKQTTRVLQRTRANTALKNRRYPIKAPHDAPKHGSGGQVQPAGETGETVNP